MIIGYIGVRSRGIFIFFEYLSDIVELINFGIQQVRLIFDKAHCNPLTCGLIRGVSNYKGDH